MSDAGVEALRAVYAEFRRGNFGAVLPLLDAGIEWRWTDDQIGLTGGAPLCGLTAVADGMAEWLSTWDWFWNEAEAFIDAGDRVVVFVRIHGRPKGSSAAVNSEQADVYSFSGEKIVRIENYARRSEALAAVGLPCGMQPPR